MRVVVIASTEPEHLAWSLSALRRWVEPERILVFNNATTVENTATIERVSAESGVLTLRAHDLRDGENSIGYINRFLRAVCMEYPDEVILKLDEDAIIVSDQSRFVLEPRSILVPGVTVNNFTTRDYLEAFWPDLAREVQEHRGMWHDPHPVSGLDYRVELFSRLYTLHPRHLIRHCEEEGVVERVDRESWTAKRLHGERGISITAIAFRAVDYLDQVADVDGVDEVLIADAVKAGRLDYLVDHGMFCHHVNYWSVRGLVQSNPDLVKAFVERVFEHYDARAAASAPAVTTLPSPRAGGLSLV